MRVSVFVFSIMVVSLMTVFASSGVLSANLLRNGDFSGSVAANGCPADWQCGSGMAVSTHKDSAGDYVKMTAKDPTTSYAQQSVPAEKLAGKHALFQADVKFSDCKQGPEGYMQARMLVQYTTPDGKSSEFYRFFQGDSDWQPVTIVCNLPVDTAAVTAMLGFHTCTGTLCVRNARLFVVDAPTKTTLSPGVEETLLGPVRTLKVDDGEWTCLPDSNVAETVPEFTDSEQKRGFVLSQRPDSMVAPVGAKPRRTDILGDKPVKASLCPCETRSAVMAVYPLDDLRSVSINFGDLKGEKGAVIPGKNLRADVLENMTYRANWFRQYTTMPKLIKRFKTIDLPEHTTSQFWIYASAPANAKPGVYKGRAKITSEGKVIGEIPIQIRVYPFKLKPTPVHWSFYYYYQPDSGLLDELKYMRNLGMNSAIYSPPASSVFARLKYENGTPLFDFSEDDAFMSAYKKTGYTAPVVYYPRLLLMRLADLTGTAKGFERMSFYGADVPMLKNESDYSTEAREAYKTTIKMIADHAKSAGWPQIILYLTDEPGLGSWTEWETKLSYGLAKEAAPQLKTYCTMYHPEMLEKYGKLIDYTSSQGELSSAPRKLNSDLRAVCSKTGTRLWASCWPGLWWHNYWYGRAYSGLVAERSGFEGMNVWYFAKVGKPTGKEDPYWSLRQGMDNSIANGGLGLYQMNENGEMENYPITEGIREGILDARYVATLEAALADAKKRGKDVRAYEKSLADILNSLPTLPISPESYFKDSPGMRDAGDWTVAKNEVARMKIAEMIVALTKRLNRE